MNPDLHDMTYDLKPRDRERGTGRTTRIIQRLLEHVIAVDKDKPPVERIGVFVISHHHQWPYIKMLCEQIPGFKAYHSEKRKLYFHQATIFVVSAENIDRIRGWRFPIAMDHHVWESEKGVPELLYIQQDRVINFN